MRRNRGQVMYMPKDGKVNEMPNPKTAEEIFAEKDARIAELEAELAALKEKYRWRRLSETKPSVEDAPLEIVYFTNDNHFDVRLAPVWPGGLAYADGYYKYWRPWDLPEEETK